MGQQGDGFGFILEGRCAVAALDEGSVLAMARCDFAKGVRNRSPRSLSQPLMIRDGKFELFLPIHFPQFGRVEVSALRSG